MKKQLLILLSMVCLSLSAKIDPYLQPFVNQFISEGKQRGVLLDVSKIEDIGFPNTENKRIIDSCSLKDNGAQKKWQGITWFYNDGMVSVYLNQELFFEYTDLYRRLLIYHELAHALVVGNKHPSDCRLLNHHSLNNNYTENDLKSLLDEVFSHNITIR